MLPCAPCAEVATILSCGDRDLLDVCARAGRLRSVLLLPQPLPPLPPPLTTPLLLLLLLYVPRVMPR